MVDESRREHMAYFWGQSTLRRMISQLVLLTLATFWLWETVRYAAESFIPQIFSATRPLHPLVVAAAPLLVLWPEWVQALAVAAAVGILHLAVEKYLAPDTATPIQLPRRRGGGLPPLP